MLYISIVLTPWNILRCHNCTQTIVWEQLTNHSLHHLKKASTKSLLMKCAVQLWIQLPNPELNFFLTLFWYTQHYPCIHTQGMTGYLPISDKSSPRSILGARTRISGIVSISSAHTWSLQGRQSQTTHQHYPQQPSTTCTISMQPRWNAVIQGSFMNLKALVHIFYLV